MTELVAIEYIVQGMKYGVFIEHLFSVEKSADILIKALEESMDLQERADGHKLRAVLTEVTATIDNLVRIDNRVQSGEIPPIMGAFLVENRYAPIKGTVIDFGELFKAYQQRRAPTRIA